MCRCAYAYDIHMCTDLNRWVCVCVCVCVCASAHDDSRHHKLMYAQGCMGEPGSRQPSLPYRVMRQCPRRYHGHPSDALLTFAPCVTGESLRRDTLSLWWHTTSV